MLSFREEKEIMIEADTEAIGRKILPECALENMEADSEFGYCNECGEQISPARLLSMPETLRCAGCAE